MTLAHMERAACLDSSVHGGWDETRKQAGAGRGSHRELSSLPKPTGQQQCSPRCPALPCDRAQVSSIWNSSAGRWHSAK